jgi:hypothetical protein
VLGGGWIAEGWLQVEAELRRVHIATLGCKVNAYDTATIADRLAPPAAPGRPRDAPADVVIVNSCTVTDAAGRREPPPRATRAARQPGRARHPDGLLRADAARRRPRVDGVDHVIGREPPRRAGRGRHRAGGTPRVVVGDARASARVRRSARGRSRARRARS